MNDAASTTVLQKILRREQRSFLQFVKEVYPWARPDEQHVVKEFRGLIDEEDQAIRDLALFLQKRYVAVGPLPQFPLEYMNLSFVSLSFLFPHLIEHEKDAISQLERDLATFTDPECRPLVERLLEMKRRHWQKLEDLAAQAALAAHV
jgi:hypothetical protein